MRSKMLLRQLDAIAMEGGWGSPIRDGGRFHLNNRDFRARPEVDSDFQQSFGALFDLGHTPMFVVAEMREQIRRIGLRKSSSVISIWLVERPCGIPYRVIGQWSNGNRRKKVVIFWRIEARRENSEILDPLE